MFNLSKTRVPAFVAVISLTLGACGSDSPEPTPPNPVVPTPDTTIPVISLNGDANLSVEAGTTFTDPGATANDNIDGDISTGITSSGNVDTSVIGDYTITYNVSDSSSNDAVEVSRTVTVADTIAPVLSLVGNTSISLEVGENYADTGAIATDSFEGDISTRIASTGSVDTTMLGEYILMYNVSDSSGNNAVSIMRTVNVVDTTSPTVMVTSPTANATNIALDSVFTATFSEALLTTSVNSANVTLTDTNNNTVAGSVMLDTAGTLLTFTPSEALSADTQYTFTLSTAITDASANGLAMAVVVPFTTLSNNTASLPVLINTQGSPVSTASLATNSVGDAVAIWRQGSIIFANRYSAQTGWQGDEALTAAGGANPFEDMSVAINDMGDIVALWTESEANSATGIYENRYTTATGWTGSASIDNQSSGLSDMPSVGIDAAGNAHAVWRSRSTFNSEGEIVSRRFDRNTAIWEALVILDADTDMVNDVAVNPSIYVNPEGYATAVWSVQGNQISAATYAPAAQWTASGFIELPVATDTASENSVSMNANGDAIAIFRQRLEGNAYASVYANRYQRGTGWAGAVAIETDDSSEARYPKIDMNNTHAVVVWSENTTDDVAYSTYANIMNSTGQWQGPVRLDVSDFPAGDSQVSASISVNPNGKAIAVWGQRIVIETTMAAEERVTVSEIQLGTNSDWSTPRVLDQDVDNAETFAPVVGIGDDGAGVVVSQVLQNNSFDLQSHKIE